MFAIQLRIARLHERRHGHRSDGELSVLGIEGVGLPARKEVDVQSLGASPECFSLNPLLANCKK